MKAKCMQTLCFTGKKRRPLPTDIFPKIDRALEASMTYKHKADTCFLELGKEERRSGIFHSLDAGTKEASSYVFHLLVQLI